MRHSASCVMLRLLCNWGIIEKSGPTISLTSTSLVTHDWPTLIETRKPLVHNGKQIRLASCSGRLVPSHRSHNGVCLSNRLKHCVRWYHSKQSLVEAKQGFKSRRLDEERGNKSKSSADMPVVEGEVLSGLYPCLLALQASRREHFYSLYVKWDIYDGGKWRQHIIEEILKLAQEKSVKVEPCSIGVLGRLSEHRSNQGFCMDVSPLSPISMSNVELKQDLDSKPKIWIVLDKLLDPMNFGAILRSCYFMGVDRFIIANDISPVTLSPVSSKSSSGVLEIMPVHSVKNFTKLLKDSKLEGWDVLGTAPPRDRSLTCQPLHKFNVTRNTIVILGQERLDSETASLCSHILNIQSGCVPNPYAGSLNISVTTGIILHHLRSSVES